jgi:hypothetical protein
VRIGTVDNPGWTLTIDLADTALSGRSFSEYGYGIGSDAEDSGNNWLHCKVEEDRFVGGRGPEKLEEMIEVFLEWARAAA